MVLKASGGIILKENKVLLMKRQNTSLYSQYWSNPGGKIELGESLEECTIRELKEELGVDVVIVRKLSEFNDYRNNALFGVYTGFLVKVIKGIPSIIEPEKTSAMDYFSFDNLPKPITPYTMQYLRELFP